MYQSLLRKEGEQMAREMTDYEKRVRIAMTEKGIRTYSELAEQVGVSNAYISDIIIGARKATEARQKINNFLGLEGE